MRKFSFDPAFGTELSDDGRVTVRWVPIVKTANPKLVAVDVMHIGPRGVLGRHPAGRPQLFLVAAGSGWVATGDEEPQSVEAGDGILWEPGEVHESGSDDGMMAVIIQLSELAPGDLQV
jgi:quercetin dioxygenase-like cupin family protein